MDRSKPAPRRKPPAFKPPRILSNSKPKSSSGPSRRKSAPAKTVSVSSSPTSEIDLALLTADDDSFPEDPAPKINKKRGGVVPSPQTPLSIPPKLLTRLLQYHFEQKKTRLGKGASELLGTYFDTFVREALARAAYEREQAPGGGKDFLEVEDLERLAPQLLMDF